MKGLSIIHQLTQDTEAVEQDDEELLGDNGQVFLAQSEGLINQEKNHQTFALTFKKKKKSFKINNELMRDTHCLVPSQLPWMTDWDALRWKRCRQTKVEG